MLHVVICYCVAEGMLAFPACSAVQLRRKGVAKLSCGQGLDAMSHPWHTDLHVPHSFTMQIQARSLAQSQNLKFSCQTQLQLSLEALGKARRWACGLARG